MKQIFLPIFRVQDIFTSLFDRALDTAAHSQKRLSEFRVGLRKKSEILIFCILLLWFEEVVSRFDNIFSVIFPIPMICCEKTYLIFKFPRLLICRSPTTSPLKHSGFVPASIFCTTKRTSWRARSRRITDTSVNSLEMTGKYSIIQVTNIRHLNFRKIY